MTVVAAMLTDEDVSLLADSRLSRENLITRRVDVARDVCHKLVHVNAWCAIGFAGHACLAGHLVTGLTQALRRTRRHDAYWLADDARVRRFVRRLLERHHPGRSEHDSCRRSSVNILVAWRDHIGARASEVRLWPLEVLTIHSPSLTIQRFREPSLTIIGSGVMAGPEILNELNTGLATFGRGTVHGHRQRTGLLAHFMEIVLRQKKVGTVGGGYQLLHLGQEAVEPIPYLAFAHVAPGYGTWIAMRIEDGRWVQEHRPTHTSIRLHLPSEIPLTGPHWHNGSGNKIFDASQRLTPRSPGVLRETNPQMGWALYRGGDPPADLAGSWGTAPLPPLTWGKPNRRSLLFAPPPVPGPG